ncbi:MAG TPA: alpha/beta fold hydrolase, partial [Acidimicrobiia bacterium]
MSAPTFVLIHGGAMSGAYWDLLLPHLRHPALAVDLPGRAGKPADLMALTVDDCVRSVVADVDAARLGDVILVAHSSGGLFTPGVAASLGQRVRH